MAFARTRLSYAAEDYLAACRRVASTCTKRPGPLDQRSYELALSAIDLELLTLDREEERIKKAREVLFSVRNLSKMNAPIYSMPSEILTRIFLEATCHQAHDETKRPICFPSSPLTLSAVCRLWRNLSVNCCLLWAHLDILIDESKGRNPRFPPSELWIDRIGNAPLQIHIRQVESYVDSRSRDLALASGKRRVQVVTNDGDFGSPDIPMDICTAFSKLLPFLKPLIPYTDALEVICDSHGQNRLLDRLLNYFIYPEEEPSRVKSVKVVHKRACEPLKLYTGDVSDDYFDEIHQSFFGSLATLDLRNTYPRWDHLALTNLVELRLEATNLKYEKIITQNELASALESCPKLRSLMLLHWLVKPSPGKPYRVNLPELQELSLRSMEGKCEVDLMLSVIIPGSHHLHMSISLPSNSKIRPRFLRELSLFLNRSNVTIFYAESGYLESWFASAVGPLPQVHTLVLKGCHFSDAFKSGSRMVANSSLASSSLTLWPELRHLHMVDCSFQKLHLQQLVALHPIRNLRVVRCREYLNTRSAEYKQEKMEEELRMLLDHVSDITVADQNETLNWSFIGTQLFD